jgi:hypothetical protein
MTSEMSNQINFFISPSIVWNSNTIPFVKSDLDIELENIHQIFDNIGKDFSDLQKNLDQIENLDKKEKVSEFIKEFMPFVAQNCNIERTFHLETTTQIDSSNNQKRFDDIRKDSSDLQENFDQIENLDKNESEFIKEFMPLIAQNHNTEKTFHLETTKQIDSSDNQNNKLGIDQKNSKKIVQNSNGHKYFFPTLNEMPNCPKCKGNEFVRTHGSRAYSNNYRKRKFLCKAHQPGHQFLYGPQIHRDELIP